MSTATKLSSSSSTIDAAKFKTKDYENGGTSGTTDQSFSVSLYLIYHESFCVFYFLLKFLLLSVNDFV